MIKLRKFLEDKTGPIKIGTNNGSSFFYIGTVEDLYLKEDRYERELRAWNRLKLQKSEEALALTKKQEPTPLLYMENFEDGDIQGYINFVSRWIEEYKRKTKTLERRREWFQNLVPLFDREVIKSFNATAFDVGMLVIIVDGTEDGYFWTEDEVSEKRMKFGSDLNER